MPQKNTPELWNDGWINRKVSIDEDTYNLFREEMSIRFQRIEKIISNRFGDFNGLRVIEIGAGAGTNAAIIAKKGAKITILDYSQNALSRSKELFSRNNLQAEFICEDALALPGDLHGKFDIAMSFGLAEHFKGEKRTLINKSHFDLLRKGGVAFIAVPHSANIPYLIHKLTAEALGWWTVGEEYAYTRKEFRDICQKINIKNYIFLGDSVWASLNLISPARLIRKLFKIRPNFNYQKIRLEKGTPIDEYFSYSLVLCAFKD